MKKKLAALAMTTVMVLSLAGCGKKIEGDYNNVVGLPSAEVYQHLKEMISRI